MQLIETDIHDVFICEQRVFQDERGFFLESYNQKRFDQALGQSVVFVQDNHSKSQHGVLRGLHFQTEHAQGKLVRCTQGRVFDVVVDIRPDSPNYGQWVGVELSADNFRQLWVPPGLAHGFLVLSDSAEFVYKTTDFYMPEYEKSIRWDDPTLDIAWPLA
ncbi:MAG: dTDP-4-dehydrorhamnose 3,5-epimerase, partial [Gammaproteobacteria bacterium]|nr:dTDP-4-dehydrorhamnose 3,5-epimerase [Gammaproteobacteria bacterium]